jgi:HSP20 family molecular chaperone IbpA
MAMSSDKNGISQIAVNAPPSPGENVAPVQAAGDRTLFTPPIDIYESDEGLVLIADLPGVSVKTLELQVQNNKLTLLGRVTNPGPSNARLLHKEYDEGDFLRSFILSEDVDHERITARLNDGVLEVVLPRASKTTPRRIEVNTD